jgi:ribosomal protein S27E
VEATVAFKALAEKEEVGTVFQEVACRGCRKFLLEIALVGGKAVSRVKCLKCGADNFLVIEPDRVTAVNTLPSK